MGSRFRIPTLMLMAMSRSRNWAQPASRARWLCRAISMGPPRCCTDSSRTTSFFRAWSRRPENSRVMIAARGTLRRGFSSRSMAVAPASMTFVAWIPMR